MSAVNAHETATILRVRHGAQPVARLWQLLTDSEIEIVSFDETQVHAAAVAFDRYGKGIHAKARLNLADCAAYALAATMNAPLLFKATTSRQPTCGRVFELIPCPFGRAARHSGRAITARMMQRGSLMDEKLWAGVELKLQNAEFFST
jgi:ribonuclease VapC